MAQFEIHTDTSGQPGRYHAFDRGPLMDIVGWGIALFAFLMVFGAVFAGLLLAAVLRLIGWIFRLLSGASRNTSRGETPPSSQSSFHKEEIIEGEFRILSDDSSNEEEKH